ncbi:hypothetical protein J3F84DRAFT_379196 [Trichoderma pleuroticola]
MGPPKPPVPHVAPIYRVTATALGAGMWFWLMYRAKKDGKAPNSHTHFSMIDSNVFNLSQDPFCLAGSTPGTTRQLDQVEIRDQERPCYSTTGIPAIACDVVYTTTRSYIQQWSLRAKYGCWNKNRTSCGI